MKSQPPYLSKVLSRLAGTYQLGRNSLLSLLFPWECLICGALQRYAEVICEPCIRILPAIRPPFCRLCGSPFPEHWRVQVCPECKLQRPKLRQIRSAFHYEGAVMEMIRQMKFGKRARYLRFFAERVNLLLLEYFNGKVDAIVPVPLHRSREWERTFNQAALLARYVAELSGVPLQPILKRRKRTRPQTGLSGMVRRRNLRGAFELKKSVPVPGSILLIDDVITTGATLEACAIALRRAGARKVYALTIARAVLKA